MSKYHPDELTGDPTLTPFYHNLVCEFKERLKAVPNVYKITGQAAACFLQAADIEPLYEEDLIIVAKV